MILVNNITKYYRSFKGIDRVSLEVPTHGSLVILGHSGSGKTTLLRLIAGLEIPDKGEIQIDGEIVSKPDWVLSPHLRNIGFVFQTPALWPHMTVMQNIFFGMQRMPKNEALHRLQELLTKTSLTKLANRYPNQISGGEARRVAIARALAPRPRYLLLDEPLINLDPSLKAEMLSLIQENARETKATLIYVTHDASEAVQISRHVLVLKEGRLDTQSQNKSEIKNG